jgi:hypothetical protein
MEILHFNDDPMQLVAGRSTPVFERVIRASGDASLFPAGFDFY